jgi:hypothetical protein
MHFHIFFEMTVHMSITQRHHILAYPDLLASNLDIGTLRFPHHSLLRKRRMRFAARDVGQPAASHSGISLQGEAGLHRFPGYL